MLELDRQLRQLIETSCSNPATQITKTRSLVRMHVEEFMQPLQRPKEIFHVWRVPERDMHNASSSVGQVSETMPKPPDTLDHLSKESLESERTSLYGCRQVTALLVRDHSTTRKKYRFAGICTASSAHMLLRLITACAMLRRTIENDMLQSKALLRGHTTVLVPTNPRDLSFTLLLLYEGTSL